MMVNQRYLVVKSPWLALIQLMIMMVNDGSIMVNGQLGVSIDPVNDHRDFMMVHDETTFMMLYDG